MNDFKNILVGVDLESNHRTLSGNLTTENQEAVDRGMELAERNGAKMSFVAVLDAGSATDRLIQDARRDNSNVFDEAHALLKAVTTRSQQRGIRTEARVLLGKSWVRIIQEVLQHQHDLVIVGTRSKGIMDQLRYGSTAMKLLRNCPCPVWVTKPSDGIPMTSLLVAHDLGPVGRHALDLGVALARAYDLQLQVLHGIEYLPVADATGLGMPIDVSTTLHHDARDRILLELAGSELARTPLVTVINGAPESAILETVQKDSIDLLIMGTIGRSGLTGVLTGNTAERLLPRLQCSLLALKPDGFQCPIPPNQPSLAAKLSDGVS
jgi:universal stress protein E